MSKSKKEKKAKKKYKKKYHEKLMLEQNRMRYEMIEQNRVNNAINYNNLEMLEACTNIKKSIVAQRIVEYFEINYRAAFYFVGERINPNNFEKLIMMHKYDFVDYIHDKANRIEPAQNFRLRSNITILDNGLRDELLQVLNIEDRIMGRSTY